MTNMTPTDTQHNTDTRQFTLELIDETAPDYYAYGGPEAYIHLDPGATTAPPPRSMTFSVTPVIGGEAEEMLHSEGADFVEAFGDDLDEYVNFSRVDDRPGARGQLQEPGHPDLLGYNITWQPA